MNIVCQSHLSKVFSVQKILSNRHCLEIGGIVFSLFIDWQKMRTNQSRQLISWTNKKCIASRKKITNLERKNHKNGFYDSINMHISSFFSVQKIFKEIDRKFVRNMCLSVYYNFCRKIDDFWTNAINTVNRAQLYFHMCEPVRSHHHVDEKDCQHSCLKQQNSQ